MRVWPAPGDPSRAGLCRGCGPSPRTGRCPVAPQVLLQAHGRPAGTRCLLLGTALQPTPHVAPGTGSWPGALRALASPSGSPGGEGLSRRHLTPALPKAGPVPNHLHSVRGS